VALNEFSWHVALVVLYAWLNNEWSGGLQQLTAARINNQKKNNNFHLMIKTGCVLSPFIQKQKTNSYDTKPDIFIGILIAFVFGVIATALQFSNKFLGIWGCLVTLAWIAMWIRQRSAFRREMIFGGIGVCLAFVLGFSHAKSTMNHALQDRLQRAQTVDVIVRVIGISDGVDENWRQVVEPVDEVNGLPKRWLLYPQFSVNTDHRQPVANLRAGELWRVSVKLSPPHGMASPAAFDQEQWLMTQHIGATGTLESATLVQSDAGGLRAALDKIDQFRNQLRDHLAQLDSPARGVLLGLLTGDSVLIDPDLRQLYQHAGISHLMAISGPHVVLAALMVAWMVQQILNLTPLIYLRVPRKFLLMPIVMLMVLGYALLAGWGVPAQRTVLMVGISTSLTLFGRLQSTYLILLIALSISLWIDPLAIYQSGLWLSFVATAILISLVRQPLPVGTWWQRAVQEFKHLVKLQVAMFVLLIPPTLAFFHQISLFSILVNLIAIPLIGFVIVPLALVALFIWPIWTGLADAVWILAAWMLEQLHGLLLKLPLVMFDDALTPVMLVGLSLAVLVWLAPRGSLPRWLIIPCVLPSVVVLMGMKPLFGAAHDAPVRVHVLDVGQGLAVLIQTKHHAMLYDTGAKRTDAREGMGERVVLPALSAAGVFHLDKMMISHADYEHIGGAAAVLARMPVAQVIGSSAVLDVPSEMCASGQHWQWDGVDFDVLAPMNEVQIFDDKDRSCVLRIRAPVQALGHGDGHRITLILMGDAGTEVEVQLLNTQAVVDNLLTADVLLLGDHGSDRASSDAFLSAVMPRREVISTSFMNQKYPAEAVLRRLRSKHIVIDSTVDSGTLTYDLGGKKDIEVTRYRDLYPWLVREHE
jgi:competence protein ComEC